MRLRNKLKRIGALLLSVMLMLSGMSFSLAEETEDIPDATEETQEFPDKPSILPDLAPEDPEPVEEETPVEEEPPIEEEIPADEPPVEEETEEKESETEISVVDPAEELPAEDEPIEPQKEPAEEEQPGEELPEEIREAPVVEEPAEPEPKEEPISNLRQAINDYGYTYALSYGPVKVYSDKAMKDLIYTTADGWNAWLVTGYTDKGVATVYCVDKNFDMVHGYIKESKLDDELVTDEDVYWMTEDYPYARKDTSVGEKVLFVVHGTWAETEESEPNVAFDEPAPEEIIPEPVIEEPTEPVEEPIEEEPVPDEEPIEEPVDEPEPVEDEPPAEEDPVEESPVEEPDEIPDDSEDEEIPGEIPEVIPTEQISEEPEDEPEEPAEEPTEEILDEQTEDDPIEELPAEEEPIEDPVEEPEPIEEHEPEAGDYVSVTTSTRVFSGVGATAYTADFPDQLEGCFVKNAVVRIEQIEQDGDGHTWYHITYRYGDDFAAGKHKWTATGTLYVLADETSATNETDLTVTDYAYTKEQLQLRNKSSNRMLMAATPMNGFTLKNISVNLGSFTAGQTGLNGSSGKDSDYPQLAKSSSHGTIYATPHYLSGYTVYCLEHTYDGPGEGSGSNMTPTGPYKLIDLDAYCNTTAGEGVSKIQFKESTMHAIGWVLRHTYPFMVLNRSDSNNNVWSRVAGQFAIREVIKKLEGSKYVRDYWDMSEFYSFSGGAPAVYLTYAKWLASNGIARAKITGKITAKNQSVSVSGSNYVGTVTLTTDADLIRIARSTGTLTGNSGGKDSDYYYIKSGDTISVTSSKNKFSVYMESISSEDEEAGFLIGVPSKSIQKIIVPVGPEPYPLKDKTITFELTYGEITVTKKANDGTVLKGAVFELLSGSTVVATATTDASGIAKFTSVTPGSYTLREKTAPQGYQLGTATTQNVTVTAGVTSTATFTNPPITKKIRIVKTDSVTGKGLPGATFTVTRLSGPNSMTATNIGKVVATITTNASGVAETGELPYGEYRIDETGVPDGYLNSGYTVTQWIK